MNGFVLLSMSLMLNTSGDQRFATAQPSSNHAMAEVNQLRTSRGFPPFQWDENLMRVAQMRAQQMANRGQCAMHPPGSFAPARYEGVGCGNQFLTCYLYSHVGRFAGAATVERGGRRFHVLLIR